MLYNQRTGRKDRFSRIVKMHADKREEIDTAEAGDIVAIMGIDCASGDTYASETEVLLAGKHVRSRAGHQGRRHARQPGRRRQDEQGPAALPQGRPDVPRLQRRRDERDHHRRHGRAAPGYLRRADSPRIQGRARSRRAEGQLPRIARPAKPSSTTSTRSRPAAPGQYAHIVGYFEPLAEGESRKRRSSSRTKSSGGRIPKNFIPSIEKGFRAVARQGSARRVSGRRPQGRAGTTARTTKSIPATGRSRPAPKAASASTSRTPSRSCSSRS